MIVDRVNTSLIFNKMFVYGLGELLAEALTSEFKNQDAVLYIDGLSALQIDDEIADKKLRLDRAFMKILLDSRGFRLSSIVQREDRWKFLDNAVEYLKIQEEEIYDAMNKILLLFATESNYNLSDYFVYDGNYEKLKKEVEKTYKKLIELKKGGILQKTQENVIKLIKSLDIKEDNKKLKKAADEILNIIPNPNIIKEDAKLLEMLTTLSKFAEAYTKIQNFIKKKEVKNIAKSKGLEELRGTVEKTIKKELKVLLSMDKLTKFYTELMKYGKILAIFTKLNEKTIREIAEGIGKIDTPPLALVADLGRYEPKLAGYSSYLERKEIGKAHTIDMVIAILGVMLTTRYTGEKQVMIIPSLSGPAIGSRPLRIITGAYRISYTEDPVIVALKILLNIIKSGIEPDKIEDYIQRINGYFIYIYEFQNYNAQPRSFKYVPLQNELSFWVKYYKSYIELTGDAKKAEESLENWRKRLINENIGKKIVTKLRSALISRQYTIWLSEIAKICKTADERGVKTLSSNEFITALEALSSK